MFIDNIDSIVEKEILEFLDGVNVQVVLFGLGFSYVGVLNVLLKRFKKIEDNKLVMSVECSVRDVEFDVKLNGIIVISVEVV